MPRVTKVPEGQAVKSHARVFAILHTVDAEGKGQVDKETLLKFANHGNESTIKDVAGKDEVAFEELATAFYKKPTDVKGDGNCVGWAAQDESGKLAPWKFKRRELRPDDVRVQITYAGMCHSDLHQIRNEWGNATYPMVPGHEMVGVVVEVGKDVKKFKPGACAAVGNMVSSCGECQECKNGTEQYCQGNGPIMTYNSKFPDGEVTHGGYSTHIICREAFVFNLDPKLNVPGGAPLLCAGITVWSPMRYYGADKPNQHIGIVGLGGLGHMAVKFAKKFGAKVTVISRSDKKRNLAMTELGADDYLVSNDEDAMKSAAKTFDAIIDTVSAQHDINSELSLLKIDGKLICVGIPSKPHAIAAAGFVMKRITIGGSLIGGIGETQEMLDFCAQHNILSTVEVINAEYVNEAIDKMEAGDVKFRFVIDVTKSIVHGD